MNHSNDTLPKTELIHPAFQFNTRTFSCTYINQMANLQCKAWPHNSRTLQQRACRIKIAVNSNKFLNRHKSFRMQAGARDLNTIRSCYKGRCFAYLQRSVGRASVFVVVDVLRVGAVFSLFLLGGVRF